MKSAKAVYEVHYEELVQDTIVGKRRKRRAEWNINTDPIHVLSGGTVSTAIKKAEKYLLGRVTLWKDEHGRRMVQRTLRAKVYSCKHLLTIDA